MKSFAQYKLASLANEVCLMCVVWFSLAGCSKYDQQQPVATDLAYYHLHGLWARNAAQVWIVGDDGDILHSTDGGERWQLQTSGTTQTLTAICGDGAQLCTVGTDFTILYSADGGLNWQPQTRAAAPHLLAVCSVGSQLWTVGYDGVILHSADGGRTWQRQSLPSD